MSASPTPRLLAGLALTLLAVGVFSWYSLGQIRGLRRLQADTIDRNRRDSLQLLRIQSNLNSLALAMRDMVEGDEPYPLEAWRSEFDRIRRDLTDGLGREAALAARPREQQAYLERSLVQFWGSAEQVFRIAQEGDQVRARRMVTNSLQAQQSSISALVARLLVANNESEEQAAGAIQQIYQRVERDIYLFLAAMLLAIIITGLSVIYMNRRVFDQIANLSEQRSTLARRLISVQEDVLRSISRELHDEFGQILTAVGAMLGRAEKKGVPPDSPLRTELAEVRDIVQSTLEKTRSLSKALHPTILDDYGLEKAAHVYVTTFTRQTGIAVDLHVEGDAAVPEQAAIHVYRVLQEALNNVARHAGVDNARVLLRLGPDLLLLEVADAGAGRRQQTAQRGLGLMAMRERAELLNGTLTFDQPPAGGTVVRLRVPISEIHSSALTDSESIVERTA